MIDFKTHDEQIEILRNRGMIIPDDSSVKEFLLLNNYYNVINGFKDIFIQQGKTPEMFISGVSFNELFALYTFDKKLRQLTSLFSSIHSIPTQIILDKMGVPQAFLINND